jgi:hypothetical protein
MIEAKSLDEVAGKCVYDLVAEEDSRRGCRSFGDSA